MSEKKSVIQLTASPECCCFQQFHGSYCCKLLRPQESHFNFILINDFLWQKQDLAVLTDAILCFGKDSSLFVFYYANRAT